MRQSKKQPTTETVSPALDPHVEALRGRVTEPAVDPILSVIAESQGLMPAVRRARRAPDVGFGRPVEEDVAADALWLHFRGTVLKTSPTTAAGAVALARHVLAFNRSEGRVLEEKDLTRALILIAAASAA